MIEPGARFLDRFTIERSLGQGGFADVWLARDDAGLAYAIKVQRADVRGDSALRAFAREGARAAELRHPHLVRIFESGVVEERGYLVMEHIDGVTLDESLERQRKAGEGVRIGEVRAWTRQLCQAIDALHAASLVHRDLKPSNIMVHGPRREVVVLDLGLAHDAALDDADLTTLGRVKGTTAYMSPEQALGERVGPASDVFALTTIVFELLTGLRPWLLNQTGGMLLVGQRVPLSTNDRVEVMRRLTSGRRPLPSVLTAGLPPILDQVFAAGWSRDPALRPVPTTAWSERLDAAFASVPAEASAWMSPRRDPSSLAGARAPVAIAEPRSQTPVALTAYPVEATVLPPIERTLLPPVEATRLAIGGGWGPARRAIALAVGCVVLGTAAFLGVSALIARPAPVEVAGTEAGGAAEGVIAPGAAAAEPRLAAPRTAEPRAAELRAAEPRVEVRAVPEPVWEVAPFAEEAAPAEEQPVGLRPSSGPASASRPAPRRPAAPRAPLAPAPPGSASPAAPSSAAEAAAQLRARLDRGDPLDDVARAVRARAAALGPEQRRAVERWAASATELGDPRPLYLAIEALAAAR